MAKFEDLNSNLIEVIMKLTESQDLCKLLYYQDDKPLRKPDIDNTYKTLFMKNIFPIPKIPSASTEKESYLTILLDEIRIGTKNIGFKNTVLCFNVMCHVDKWMMDGSLRPYAIMSEIDKLFNNQKVVGIGKVQFEKCKLIAVNEKYYGYRMEYLVCDFS
ncbi:hypothetical protein NV379_02635 [Paenibacillus sp. N1-5-1-14]|uniref:hypothetical protein n=1 Tax=Paenibacillus radicibacter TaxID=2972488 RepID=UPI0021596AD5|nr:hypothetical protein [Paenibacillus radicibacter]MCR8641543.1 hypothetical protein [Paenibacillus radicibacter]